MDDGKIEYTSCICIVVALNKLHSFPKELTLYYMIIEFQ